MWQRARFASVLIWLLLATGALRAQESAIYSFSCDSAAGNLRSEETVCVGVRISDGVNDISAGRATTNRFDFDGSLWHLSDGIAIALETAEIVAEEALLRFEQGTLILAEINGSPVRITDYIDEQDASIIGSAESLSYDGTTHTVQLLGEATLADGQNEVIGCDLTYNLDEKTYQVGSEDDCGIVFRLAPANEPDAEGSQPDPP